MRRFSKGICALVIGATLSTLSCSAFADVNRVVGGENRYSTAAKVAESGWKYGTSTIVLVNGEAIVDALAATPYARYKDAPILLTQKDVIPNETKNTISNLGVYEVVIVGGEGVVSNNVVMQLENMGISVKRISGVNRYETASEVARNLDYVDKVAIVNGITGLADALSVAAPAARDNMAIILSDGESIISGRDIVEKASEKYVIGGSGVVSESLVRSISATRLGGVNRGATNATVLERFYPDEYLSKVYLAKDGSKNQSELVDALAVGSLAGREGNPVILLGNSITVAQENYLMPRLANEIVQIGYGLNGNSADEVSGDLKFIGLPKEEKDKTPRLKEVKAINGEVIVTLTNPIDKAKLDDFYVTKQVDGGKKIKVTPNKVVLADNKIDVILKMNEEPRENWNKRINYEVRYKNGDLTGCWFKIIHEGKGPMLSVSEIPDILKVNELKMKVTAPKNDATSLVLSNNGVKYYKDKKNEYTLKLSEGNNDIVIIGTNAKGDETKITKRIVCDTTTPTIKMSKIPGRTYDNILKISVDVNEPCDIVVKNGEYNARACGNNEYEVELSDGYNVISVQAKDRAGNIALIKNSIKKVVPIRPTKSECIKDVVKFYGVKDTSELDLMDKEITLIEQGTNKKFIATYINNSYRNQSAEFKINNNGELEDAKKYKIEAEWGDFSNCDLIAKLKPKVVEKLYVLNQVLTVGDRTIKTETIDQYGDKLYLNKHENKEVKLKIDGKLVDIVQSGNDFRIVNPLQSGKEVKIQFFNEDKPISEVVKFTVREGEPSKQTKIENLKLYKFEKNDDKETVVEKSLNEQLIIGDKIKLTADVKDQYGNTLTSDLAKIKWTNKSASNVIDICEASNSKDKVHERPDGLVFEVKDIGLIDIVGEIENKANVKYTNKINHIDVRDLKFNIDKLNEDKMYSNQRCRIGILEGNTGSRVIASRVKFSNTDDIKFYATQGTGNNRDKVFIDAIAKAPETYKCELRYDKLQLESDNFTIKINPEIKTIEMKNLSNNNEVEIGQKIESEINFLNINKENVDVKEDDIKIKITDDKGKDLSEFVNCKFNNNKNKSSIEFEVRKEGKYNIVVENSKFGVSKKITLTARKLNSIELKNEIDVIQGEEVIVPIVLKDNLNSEMKIDKFDFNNFKATGINKADIIYYKKEGNSYKEVGKEEAYGVALKINIPVAELIKDGKIEVTYSNATEEITASINVIVKQERTVSEIIPSPLLLTINKGESKEFTVTLRDQYKKNICEKITSTISEGNKIKLEQIGDGKDGVYKFKVTANNEGLDKITLKAGKKSIEIPVTVQDKSKIPNGITISCKEDLNKLYSTREGEVEFNFSATVKNSDGIEINPKPSIKWSVNVSKEKAEIDETTGIVTVKKGTDATITITATANNRKTGYATLKVSNKQSIAQKETMKLFLNGKEIGEGTELKIGKNTTLKATAMDQYGDNINNVEFGKAIFKNTGICEANIVKENVTIKPIAGGQTQVTISSGNASVSFNIIVTYMPSDDEIMKEALDSKELNIRDYFPKNRKEINLTKEMKIDRDIDFGGLKISSDCIINMKDGIVIQNLEFDTMKIIGDINNMTIFNFIGKNLDVPNASITVDKNVKVANLTMNKKPAKIENFKIVIDKSSKPQVPSDEEKPKSNSEV
ncbi:cell wall-binding repeat-containing protein [Clostridium ihumii]|uniref:cell wall-binding repeat-containing protein n=1 Tax=Clostridium ihumii TaxID=1470356 RepID=UPI0006866F46|nr:cell wall-binding repeat-containing protein [Clostridium ihumii]